MKRPFEFLVLLQILDFLHLTKGFSSDQFQTSKVRQWTEWYNTDSPSNGVGDDEGLANIRRRSIDICGGNTPINAVCRVAQQHSIVFNEQTAKFTDDNLIIPCNEYGIICRNEDQINRTCLDYEIRFECLDETYKENSSAAVIGVAAGLSIIIPILCVIVMHVVRLVKRRRNRNNPDSVVGNSDQGSQTDQGDLPPSYSDLFGQNPGSQENLIGSGRSRDNFSLANESGHVNVNRTSSAGNDSLSRRNENFGIYTILPRHSISEQLSSVSSIEDQVNNSNNQSAFSRLRFPGLHLSIFDMFSTSLNTTSTAPSTPTSPDLSYIQTPPPTYIDAMKILEIEKSKLQQEEIAETK